LPETTERYREYVADYPTNAEVIQPPLYHALLAPLYRLAPDPTLSKLFLLRLVAVPLGVLVVWLAYLTARLLFPEDLLMRAGTPIFVAFHPQVSFEAAIVNHDILVIALFSLTLYALLRWLRDGLTKRRELALGVLGACGLWTKASFGLMLPVVALAMVFAWRDGAWPVRRLVGAWVRTIALPLVLVAPWFARSFYLYGDPTGASRLRDIYGDQASSYWAMISDLGFWRGRLEDFWGNYGWRLIPFDPEIYRTIWVVWTIAGAGLLLLLGRSLVRRVRPSDGGFTRFQRRGVTLMAVSIAFLLYGVLYVGTIQFTQSRFVFPGIVAFGVLTMLGLGAWLPARLRPIAVPVLAALLILLNVVTTLRFLIPYYYGTEGGALILP
jgi:4-amino-4-deoxy-L-arabinose transferase-like glycosyltransferase